MNNQFIGKVLAEKYRIDSLMQEGALGSLYRGTHLLMDKSVCIKILPAALAIDETIVKSFANEARTVSRISHPNVLNVTDYGSDSDKTSFIVYEDASGEKLTETINRVGKFPLKRANHVVKEIAAALSVAHSNGIIHQNLTSENILIRRTPSDAEDVKVMNFGTSPFDINDLDYPVEKAQYLSPEQCSNTGEIDERTDIYSLGIILYEMLAGGVPFTAVSTTDLMLRHIQETPPRITIYRRDLPEQVDDILLKALAKNPEIRFQTAAEFANELDQIALIAGDPDEQVTIVSQRNAANATPPNYSQNNLWKTAFIVLAGVSLLGAFFIYMTQGKKTDPSTSMQTDANGSPVQPVSPPTGAAEQGLANMDTFNPNIYSNSNTGVLPDGGGGVTNPYWDSDTRPPGIPPTAGGYGSNPYPVPSGQVQPGGQQVYVAPDGSIFMPNENGNSFIMVPKNSSNSNTNTQTKGKNSNSNVNGSTSPSANTAVKPPANTAAGNTTPPETKPSPTPKVKITPVPKIVPKPEVTPKTDTAPPATTEKRPQSGKQQDT